MDILQLCCFSNLWPDYHNVESWDLRNGKDIFDIPSGHAKKFDLVAAAPPCDQFTKANAHHWEQFPEQYVKIACRAFHLCKESGGLWFLENPPGRIESFIPELKQYRVITWRSPGTNKEYIIYSNFLIMQMSAGKRYGRTPAKKFNNMTKKQREEWDPALISDIYNSIKLKFENA
jgi:hypothetical protein